jgi:hypothetical protein
MCVIQYGCVFQTVIRKDIFDAGNMLFVSLLIIFITRISIPARSLISSRATWLRPIDIEHEAACIFGPITSPTRKAV